jgi:amino acid transporter
MSGGLVAMTLSQYTSWHPWWGPFSLVLTAGAIWLTARGVKLSTTAVGAAVLVQVAIMVAVCLLVLVDQRAALSGIPFSWAHLTGGLAGLSSGFPLALFMFIGWEKRLRARRGVPQSTPHHTKGSVHLGGDRGCPARLVRLRDHYRFPL